MADSQQSHKSGRRSQCIQRGRQTVQVCPLLQLTLCHMQTQLGSHSSILRHLEPMVKPIADEELEACWNGSGSRFSDTELYTKDSIRHRKRMSTNQPVNIMIRSAERRAAESKTASGCRSMAPCGYLRPPPASTCLIGAV